MIKSVTVHSNTTWTITLNDNSQLKVNSTHEHSWTAGSPDYDLALFHMPNSDTVSIWIVDNQPNIAHACVGITSIGSTIPVIYASRYKNNLPTWF